MNRNILINKTINNISLLPVFKLKEVSEYVDFLLKTYDNKKMTEGIMELTTKSFEFLAEEEELYNESDLIENSDEKRRFSFNSIPFYKFSRV